jgi:UDP-glucose 4-epimerase
MTRFLMSLSESVDLVEHAFLHAQPGDLFVRKAPACTVEVLAKAVASLFGQDDPDIKMIGTRHGEKLHETLLSREEMVRATDQGRYFKVPLDVRTLQYERFYEDGDRAEVDPHDYTSENTDRLDLEDTRKLLLTLPELDDLLRVELERVAASMKVPA